MSLLIQESPSPNFSSRDGQRIEGVIIHFTSGGNADGTLKWFSMKEASASSHYVVSRSGDIFRCVDEANAAWHAGSRTTTPTLHGRKGLNRWTIGIELCNWGPLYQPMQNETFKTPQGIERVRAAGCWYTRLYDWTQKYHGLDPLGFTLKPEASPALQMMTRERTWPGGPVCWWEPFSIFQLKALAELLRDLFVRYPAIRREFVATHMEVDPQRKLDVPREVLPLDSILDDAYGIATSPSTIAVGSDRDDPEQQVSVVDYAAMYDEPRCEPDDGERR